MCCYDLLAWQFTDMTPKAAGRLRMKMCLRLLQRQDSRAFRPIQVAKDQFNECFEEEHHRKALHTLTVPRQREPRFAALRLIDDLRLREDIPCIEGQQP